MPSTIEIRTKDGGLIYGSVFTPDQPNGNVIVIGSAIGLHREYYFFFASFFRKLGYVVVCFDFRGIGQSAPARLRGFKGNLHQWACQDIDAVLLYTRNTWPNQEIIYIGHCISGEIIGLAQGSQYINKIVLISSALSCEKLWPLKGRLKKKLIKTFMPVWGMLLGYTPGQKIGLHGKIPNTVMHQWGNWCNSPNGLFDSFPDHNYHKLRLPMLVYTFTDDWRCPPKAVEELLNRFSNTALTWHHIDPVSIGEKRIGHNGFFDLSMRTKLWVDISVWLVTAGKTYGQPKKPDQLNETG